MRDGYLDLCMQSHCSGWAVDGDAGASLAVYVNSNKVSDITCKMERPELAAYGLPVACGFHHVFDAPLGVEDVVEVKHLDGQRLKGSPSRSHSCRLRRLLTGITPEQRGLELGALDHPTIGKNTHDVRYVDHASRADLQLKYKDAQDQSLVCLKSIVDVDYVWKSGKLLDVSGGNYDYCLASHVIEHVGNPIGWLISVAEVLSPGGHLNLAIPDKTRTFDYRRALTQPSHMLDAWVRDVSKPTFGQIFDHIAGVFPIGSPPPEPYASVREAFRVAWEIDRAGLYADVHCHVWDLDAFQHCWRVIEQIGVVPLKLQAAYPAEENGFEFVVAFTRT